MNKIKEAILDHVGFFIFSFLGLMVVCLIIVSPDIVGRKFFPEKHWSSLVKDLEKSIKGLEYEINNARINLQKEIITTPLEVSRFEKERGKELIIELQKEKIELSQKQLDILEESLSKKREELESATAELSKYQSK